MTKLIAFDTETNGFMGGGLPDGALTECYGKAAQFTEMYAGFYHSIQDIVYNGDLISYDYTDAETRILASYSGVGVSKIILDEQEHLNSYIGWLTKEYYWCNMMFGCSPCDLSKIYRELELNTIITMLGNTNYYKGWAK